MKNHLISIILGCMVMLCALAGCQSDESPEASVSVPPTNPTTNIPVESNAVQSDSVKSDYPKSVEEGILSRIIQAGHPTHLLFEFSYFFNFA